MSLRHRMEVIDVNIPTGSTLPECEYTEYKRERVRDEKHKWNAWFGVLLLILLAVLFNMVYKSDSTGPVPLMLIDEETHPDSFIAERAQNILQSITDLGSRVVGSHINEEVTVSLLKRQIEHIQKNANKEQLIEYEMQMVSGSFFLGMAPKGYINTYANVQNVIVRIKGTGKNAVLINAHFDSVPTSPGASDDGIMCAVMLEVLEKLSKLPQRPTHDLIFLFNGAEETMIQASHGFITQHKWATSAKVIVNLEAAGSGHKEILFQTGPRVPWLLQYYSRVPHPYGQAIGEEIYQNDLIPSETDFRIFRDFGKLVGYDMAFPRNGYRYHTKFDSTKYIPLWSYQHVGDNVLSLIKDLSHAPEISDIEDSGEGTIVYYDFFGYFMIAYSHILGVFINLLVVLMSVAVAAMAYKEFDYGMRWSTFRSILHTYGFIGGGWLVSLFIVYIIAVILDASDHTMSWFTNTWILFGLYCTPILFICFGSFLLCNYYTGQMNLSDSIQIQLQIHLIRMIWTFFLLIGTLAGVRSVYSIMIPVLFNSTYFGLLKLFKWQYTSKLWQMFYLASTVIPTALLMYQSVITTSLFVPITARIGADKNPELILGGLCGIFTLAITSYYAPLIGLIKRPHLTMISLFGIFLGTLFIISTFLGFPYSESSNFPTPQRFTLHHTSRTFRDDNNSIVNEDSGIFFLNMDRNSPHSIHTYVPELEHAESIASDCEKYLVCGLPVGSPKMLESIKYSTWFRYEKPIYLDPISLTLNSKTRVNAVIRYSFTMTGPDHSTIYFKPRGNTVVKGTSLADVSGTEVVFINYVQGKLVPLNFTIDVQPPESYTQGPLLDMAITGRYVHNEAMKLSKEYSRLIKSFPLWADVTPTVSKFESFAF